MVNLGHFIQGLITVVAAASLDVAFLIPTPRLDNKLICFPLYIFIQDGSRREFCPLKRKKIVADFFQAVSDLVKLE